MPVQQYAQSVLPPLQIVMDKCHKLVIVVLAVVQTKMNVVAVKLSIIV